MRSYTIIIFSAMLTLAAPSLRAQWVDIAPNLVTAEQQHVGAIRFHGGVAWAGTTSLYYSMDTGSTWKQSTAFQAQSGITDIAIYDSFHILVSTLGDGLFITTNAGQTWTNSQPTGSRFNQPSFYQVAFDGSALVLHALVSDASVFYTSLDGGVTWNGVTTTNTASIGALSFAISSDKIIYVYSISESRGNNNVQGWIDASTDLGQTWNALNGDRLALNAHGDSYNITADSCDGQRLYLVNENVGAQSGGNQGRIDMTTDAGTTWQTVISVPLGTPPLGYYNGSLASTPNVLYVGTVPNSGAGVNRSTDSGVTWYNIGGPNEEYDTRSIATVNDNIVLVLDADGSVWRTLNSGGYPVKPFSSTPSTVFASDTVLCTSLGLTRSIVFSAGNCSPLSIAKVSIIGEDSASYKISTVSNDSIAVTLNGTNQGQQQGELVVMLDNGATDTITLAGYVETATNILSLTTENEQTDTLGGTVMVPIAINGLAHTENVDLVLHYNGTLDYLGSFSTTGVRLDIPGDSSLGRSKLQIIAVGPGQIAGYAEFNVFNDSGTAASATFDSVDVVSATSPCEYSMPASATSAITTLSGCGIMILSQFIHSGQEPLFSIAPNPAIGNAWIYSNANVGNVTIDVYDMLGTARSERVATLQKGSPVEIALPDADGVYNILLKSSAGMSSLRVVRQH